MTTSAIMLTLPVVAILIGLAAWGLVLFPRPSSWILAMALGVTSLLVLLNIGIFAASPETSLFYLKCTLYAEGAMVPIWLFCSLTFARGAGQWYNSSRSIRFFLTLSFLLVLLPFLLPFQSFYYSPDFPGERVLFLTSTGFCYYVIIMGYLVLALIQFETTLTNASPQALWNLKYHLIGLCLILAVQVFYYSQALLYRTINMDYAILRSIMFLAAGLFMLYANFRRNTAVKITISRQMALKSVVLFSVGIYLVLLGLLGEGLKYCSAGFSRSVGMSLAFLMGVGLLFLLLSDRVRREIKVVLHKHFYQNKYDYRTQWLLFTKRLSSPHWEEMLQSVLEAYCETFGMEAASLFLYDENRGTYSSAASWQMDLKNEVIHKDNSLVSFMQQKGWVFSIRDQAPDVLKENQRFLDEHNVSFVVPLPDTQRIEGFIVLGKMVKPDESYSYEDFDLMKTYALQALQTIQQHRLSSALMQTREEAAIGNVATFVMHDLKNQVAALSLITENAPRLITNPEFQKDLIYSIQSTVQKMRELIGSLKTLDKQKLLYPQQVDLLALLKHCANQFGNRQLSVSGHPVFAIVDHNEIEKVVMNLLVNAAEASEPETQVLAEVGENDGEAFIRVSDSGKGMTPQFMQSELFVPFHSTKTTGLGIGLFQSRQIIQAHGGRIDVESTEGKGSSFTIRLPKDRGLQ